MTDRSLRQFVVEELDFEPSVDAEHIGVAVDNGIVTLSGHVKTFAEKLAAMAAVRRVKGVRGIAEEMEVRFPNEKKTSDDQIAKRAADIIQWNSVVPQNTIEITVRNGWVTLSGHVDWWYQKTAAENAVRKLSGVSGVINNITIRPHIQPIDVKRKIEDAFKRRAELDSEAIRVAVSDGGKITLQGTVHDWREQIAAVSAAWSAPGVVSVDDRLTLG